MPFSVLKYGKYVKIEVYLNDRNGMIRMKYDDIAVLIPTLNPKERFTEVINKLVNNGFNNIIIVDDGSSNKAVINKINGIKILTHDVNMGKGAALKTGFNYISNLNVKGVITLDDDLQQDIENIKKICDLFLDNQGVYFGVRLFEGAPFSRKFSNKVTSFMFKKLYKEKIIDTQTGLRIFPKDILKDLIIVRGNGFEYEMNVLKYLVLSGIKINQVFIKTIYFNEKNASHYKVLSDSFLIYKELFRRNYHD